MSVRHLELSMPSSGEHFVFRSSARTTGEFSFLWTLAAGKTGPAEHLHPHETERFRVVSGRLTAWIEDDRHELGPGDELAVPPGARHRFHAPGPDPAVVEVSLDGDRFEDQFIPLAAMLPEGRSTPTGREMFRALPHIVDSFRRGAIGAPPGLKGRLMLGAFRGLGAIARLFGARPLPPVIGWDAPSAAAPAEHDGVGDAAAS